MQALDDSEALILSVRHAVYVPPGAKLKPGHRVVITGLPPAGSSSSSSSDAAPFNALNGMTATVASMARDAEAVLLELDDAAAAAASSSSSSSGAGGQPTSISVSLLNVALLREQPEGLPGGRALESGTVVLAGLAGRRDLNGRMGVLEAGPGKKASTER